ncbi:MAG: hypothetical protein JXB35_00265 [Anaerolineae bacterium]|nr:hypothetical protein [Anaerolineae bacterium]
MFRAKFLVWILLVASAACVLTPSPSGPCTIHADANVAVYQRPSTVASVFGTLMPGDTYPALVRTVEGWFGFDPGVAQAANTGVFRYRWIEKGVAGLQLEGDCEALPVVVGPPPGVCFDMPMESVLVYAAPDLTTTVVATLVVEDYAAIVGRTGDGAWYKVDLEPGNTGLAVVGWIEGWTINMNGPCDALPVLTP